MTATGAITYQETVIIQGGGRGTRDCTRAVERIVGASGVDTGLAHVFLQHTSASLMICENADPAVRADLETFFSRLVPDGDPMFTHQAEGPDDMSAHVRTLLTHTDLTVPVSANRLVLGTWQGIYLWEHRYRDYGRSLTVTVTGSPIDSGTS